MDDNNPVIGGRYEIIGDPIAELWTAALAKRFPNTLHHHCFQQMRLVDGEQYPQPYTPVRCQDWHCPRCGNACNMYGHHDCEADQ